MLVAAPLAVLSNAAEAQSFNQFIGFGDSTIDSGWWNAYLATHTTNGNQNESNLIINAIANGTNGAPVGAGNLNNSQILASLFGLTATPANQPGGTNYAIAGAVDAATAANNNIGNLNSAPPPTMQVQYAPGYKSQAATLARELSAHSPMIALMDPVTQAAAGSSARLVVVIP